MFMFRTQSSSSTVVSKAESYNISLEPVQNVKTLMPNIIHFLKTTDNKKVATEQFLDALWGKSAFPRGLQVPFQGVDKETKNNLYLLINNQVEKSKKSSSGFFQKPTKKVNIDKEKISVEPDKILQALHVLSKHDDKTLARIIKELPSPFFNNIEMNTFYSSSIDSNNKVNQLLASTQVSESSAAISIKHEELTSNDIVRILKDSKLEFAGCGSQSLAAKEVTFINAFVREYSAMDEYNPTLLKAKMQPYLEQLYAFYWSQEQDFINKCSSGNDIRCTHLVGLNTNFDESKLYEQLKRDELNKEHFKTNADYLFSLHGLIGYLELKNQIQYVYINPIVYLLLIIKYTDLDKDNQIRLARGYVDIFSKYSKRKIN